ncbi:MAG TPA: T9SS type A sorting domain-containing protein [Bacteroidia bacterium]|jgi:hypothetical protein|nr:T9SS type A sorting domain-containing protein [Bacteroidia bacterium]
MKKNHTSGNIIRHTYLVIVLFFSSFLNAQNTYVFTTAGATGNIGPSQSKLDSAYASTNLSSMVKSNGGIQTWTVPVSSVYHFEVCGAQGGSEIPIKFGGKGACMKGDFYLVAGSVLKILVGQQGSSGSGCYGGGGGSFVSDTLNNPFIIAGGGGGAGGLLGGNGIDASIGVNGTAGAAGGAGGINGNGGSAVNTNGGSGGGFYSDGTGVFYMPQCSTAVGLSFINGGNGGQFDFWLPGGFGGGGSGWDGNGNGGGGGGYSGGGTSGSSFSAGGGGGSYNAGSNQANTPGTYTGDGRIIITEVISMGLSSLTIQNKINVSPNPNNGNFVLDISETTDAFITIRNLFGEIILIKKAEAINRFELNDISAGYYNLTVSVKGTVVGNKVFVKE